MCSCSHRIRRFAIVAAVVIYSSQEVSATQFRVLSGKSEEQAVCVSLAVYEDVDYIDALVENFLAFSEPTTKLAIHLNVGTEYKINSSRWHLERVVISSERILVRPFEGSILYAHLLNAKTMEKLWPGECGHWVLQASNMMWVREGMEQRVRQTHFSPIAASSTNTGCHTRRSIENSKIFVDFTDTLIEGKQLYGWGQPEGSFFPMKVLQGFNDMLDKHLQNSHDNGAGIYEAKCLFENVWLQTYALNYELVPAESLVDSRLDNATSTPLCLNWLMPGGTLADKDRDSIPMDKIDAVMKGEYENYYAVKRVNRHLDHPITKFIVNMSQEHALLRKRRQHVL